MSLFPALDRRFADLEKASNTLVGRTEQAELAHLLGILRTIGRGTAAGVRHGFGSGDRDNRPGRAEHAADAEQRPELGDDREHDRSTRAFRLDDGDAVDFECRRGTDLLAALERLNGGGEITPAGGTLRVAAGLGDRLCGGDVGGGDAGDRAAGLRTSGEGRERGGGDEMADHAVLPSFKNTATALQPAPTAAMAAPAAVKPAPISEAPRPPQKAAKPAQVLGSRRRAQRKARVGLTRSPRGKARSAATDRRGRSC